MIRMVNDPALADGTTLILYLGSHEWYFWFKDRKLKHEHYVNPDYREDYTRDL